MTIWRHIAFLDPSLLNPGGNLSNIGDPFDLGNGVSLTHLKSYMREPPIAKILDAHGRDLLSDTSFVLITDFEADDTNRDEQTSQAFDRAFSAAAAIWLSRPCPVGIHNAVNLERVGEADVWTVRAHVVGLQRFAAHPDDADARLVAEDLQLAMRLNTALTRLPENSPTWTAKWFLWLALRENHWDVRYLCLWSALEALFGEESKKRDRFLLDLATFLERGGSNTEALLREAQSAYSARSKVVHGSVLPKNLGNDRKLKHLRSAETWVRRSLCRIVQDRSLLEAFSSNTNRRAYLVRICPPSGHVNAQM